MSALVPLAGAHDGCGAKAATLGRLLRHGVQVPPGFVVEDALGDDDWVRALPAALHALGPGPYAVRSSAVGEDGAGASFAGQLRTALDVAAPDDVAHEVRRVAASATGAATYAARVGRPVPRAVPVLVQPMVRADVAGVLFTRHPVTGADRIVIEAAAGTAEGVVNGAVTPHQWVLDGEGVTGPASPADHVLTPRDVRSVARAGRRIEKLLGGPQDIEWAVAAGTLWVLQARPVTTAAASECPVGSGEEAALVTGTPASSGVAHGPVRVIRRLDDFSLFRPGDVLVCRATSPAWTPLLARAAAVVTDVGGVLAHAAIVAREFGIPAVTGTGTATRVLTDAARVVVDGAGGRVLDGTRPAPEDR